MLALSTANVSRPVHHAARLVRHLRGTDVCASPIRCRDDIVEPVLALTFDDGPNPTYTPRILSILRDHNIKASV